MTADAKLPSLGQLWAGNLFGTNTGKLFVELTIATDSLKANVKLNDDAHGAHTFIGTGTFDGSVIQITATEAVATQPAPDITIVGQLTSDGLIRGRWSSNLGTAGTFVLFPHDVALAGPHIQSTSDAKELNTATRSTGALRISRDRLRNLMRVVADDFNNPQLVLTYRERGKETARYAADFENSPPPGPLDYLRLFISEAEAPNINRVVTVELDARGKNEVRVQGVNESWVVGKAESVRSELERSERWFLTTTHRFGLNINGVLLLAAVCAIPDLPAWWRRVTLMLAVLAIIRGIALLHRRYVSNLIINVDTSKPDSPNNLGAQAASGLIAALASLAAAVIYGLLKGEFGLPHK